MKKKAFAGIIISIIFIYLAFRNINYYRLLNIFREVHYIYIIPAILPVYLWLFIRAVRWKYLMSPIKETNLFNLFSATAIGFMVNNIFPARLGEFARAYVIGRKENISKTSSFATIVIERIFDGLSILSILFAILYLMDFPNNRIITSQFIKRGGIFLLLIYAIIILVLLIIGSRKEIITNVLKLMLPSSISKKLTNILLSFSDGLMIISGNRYLLRIVLYSFLLWIVNAFPVYLIFKSFNLHLPLLTPIFLLTIISFAVLLPSSPGHIGTYHAGCIYGLSLFSVPKEEALSIAIILHAVSFFPIIILGLIFLWIENITLKEVHKDL